LLDRDVCIYLPKQVFTYMFVKLGKPNQIKIPDLIQRGGPVLQVLYSEGLERGDPEELLLYSLE